MARGERDLRVNFLANVRDFLRGTKDAGRALEDLEQDFKDTDRASDVANRSMQDAARKTARHLDDTSKKAGGRFKEAGSEIGSEFAENFGEAIRSGNPLGAVAETATSLGPALGLAGIAAAAGTGIVMGIVNRINDQRERLRQAGNSMYEALRDGVLDAAEREDLVTSALGKDTYADALGEAIRLAKALGVETYQVLDYIESGGKDAAPELAAALARVNAQADTVAATTTRLPPEVQKGVSAVNDLEAATGNANSALERGVELAGVQAERVRNAAYWQGILNQRAQNYVDYLSRLYASDPNNPAITGRYPSTRG